ncbi:cryptochrome/photolyase family protein [Chitinolyticbacter meiyuanensis]|uniref:cryptochrome/photolyase family protein n=1 Tax=Chitinolyticbacter meiyuanensis TaxID=682798 RepID=UPI0011E5D46A|nr:deoxyribodipyrimidine photo-lyase [Chitinolyticbacter meiyuanensis]
MSDTALVWLRRDLRLFDHAALYHALRRHERVVPVFVFDTDILDALPRSDRRVEFIWESVTELKRTLQQRGSDLVVRNGSARMLLPQLSAEFDVVAVYANHDDDPFARERDDAVAGSLAAQGVTLHTFKDQVIFERDEVLTQAGSMYSVFTPYKRAWLAKLDAFYLKSYPVARYEAHYAQLPAQTMPTLETLGFTRNNLATLKLPTGMAGGETLFADFQQRMDRYHEARDYPAVKGPSYLSTHLRFGTVSIRELARFAWQQGGAGAETWLSELCWRDFYHQILHHRPDVVAHAFKPEYDTLPFPNRKDWFTAWCEGRTGYPIIDAAMRQLNQTGYMHNRLRMIAASFLVKDLLIDWRWGERYFATQLLDFDLAANNGGWQWAASTGCDAQPYFRIFNPVTQSERFDTEARFIKRYCPELAALPAKLAHAPWRAKPIDLAAAGIVLGRDYPEPIVDHAVQRQLALALFQRT